MDLSEQQKVELTAGGPTEMHHHPRITNHGDLEQMENIKNIVDTSISYAAILNDDIIVANSASGSITITLPGGRSQKEFTVTRSSALNSVTIAFSNGELCYGQATLSIIGLGAVLRLKFHLGIWITT